jgi:hypothetical protein
MALIGYLETGVIYLSRKPSNIAGLVVRCNELA